MSNRIRILEDPGKPLVNHWFEFDQNHRPIQKFVVPFFLWTLGSTGTVVPVGLYLPIRMHSPISALEAPAFPRYKGCCAEALQKSVAARVAALPETIYCTLTPEARMGEGSWRQVFPAQTIHGEVNRTYVHHPRPPHVGHVLLSKQMDRLSLLWNAPTQENDISSDEHITLKLSENYLLGTDLLASLTSKCSENHRFAIWKRVFLSGSIHVTI